MGDNDSTSNKVISKPITENTEIDGNASSLPPEILVNIFGFLCSITDLLSCAQVNQSWHHVITAFYIWHTRRFASFETFSRFHEVLQSIARARRRRALDNWRRFAAAFLTESYVTEGESDEEGGKVRKLSPLERPTYCHSTRFYGHFVIKLDLSKVHKKKLITEKMLCELFPNVPNLEYVNFYNCYTVTNEVIKKLTESCHRLKKLKLFGCTSLTDQSLDYVGSQYPELVTLDIGFCTYVSSEGLQRLLSKCRQLTSLTISHCSNAPSNSLIPVVKSLHGLQKLVMYRSVTSDLIVKSLLPKVTRLRKLDLGISKPKITDQSAEVIARNCPNLNHLSLSFSLITCEGLKEIAQGCRSITFIDLSGCSSIGHGISDVLKHFTKLKTINLQSLSQISEKSFSAIIKSHVEHVSLFNSKILETEEEGPCDPPSGEEKSNSKLKKLILDYCEISNKNLKQIAHWAKNLEYLDISLVYDIDDDVLQYLCENLKNLKVVLAKGCYRISVAKQNELNNLPNIEFTF